MCYQVELLQDRKQTSPSDHKIITVLQENVKECISNQSHKTFQINQSCSNADFKVFESQQLISKEC